MAPSFATISSSGPNSAMPLYTPSADSDRPLSTHEMYMCDSGGHYVDGTTDVTRTVHFGSPSQEQKVSVIAVVMVANRMFFCGGIVDYASINFVVKIRWKVL